MKGNFKITSSLAQMIVDAAKEVIGNDINLINLDGMIIASTDVERIGSIHSAAFDVLEKKSVIEVSEENTYKGTRKGINYPIMVDGNMLGVIGISGNPEECKSLGFLLTKITEVMIKEQMMEKSVRSLEEMRSAIVRKLIFEEEAENMLVNDHLLQMHYALEERAFVSIIRIHELANTSSSRLEKILLGYDINLYTYSFPNQYIVIVNESQYSTVQQLSGRNGEYSIGIGSIKTLDELGKSFAHAKLALKYALEREVAVCEYTKLDLEMVIENIDVHIRKDYTEKLIGDLSEEEISLLRTYYNNNLSLKKTAEELYIHKNTLQYRLEKISDITGLNPRGYHDSVKLYIALLLQT